MSYINLKLKKDDDKVYYLADILSIQSVIVLLGAAGGGKSSILKKYQTEHNSTQLLTIKKFLKLDNQVKSSTKILLLDGLDEYRSLSDDKTFVITELGSKINQLADIKIVISCREMDWYGESDGEMDRYGKSDKNALKDEIEKEVDLYHILPLDYMQKRELANLFSIDDVEKFIKKFDNFGFLGNPQMFSMLVDIYKNDSIQSISSKRELYLTFVKNARESNREYTNNKINELEVNEILKYSGYLAFYSIFSNVDTFDESVVDSVLSKDDGYNKETIVKVLKTKLFIEKSFIHRTITEFLLANFLVEYKIEKETELSISRIKSLFVKNNKIPTALRGTYAWLCSISKVKKFIKVDPYYQALHGDNTMFDNEFKKRIILEVKEYAKKNPYFFDFTKKVDLDGFYDEELDDFLMFELDSVLDIKNHYSDFLISIMISTQKLSSRLISYLKSKIIDNSVQHYMRTYMVKSFSEDIEFLRMLLKGVEDGKFEDDEDGIKENILNILYPKYIGYEEIIPYLFLYKSEVTGYCYYLNRTPYANKLDMVKEIYKLSHQGDEEHTLLMPENIESFVQEYFLETLLEYKESLSAEDIYDIILYFQKYYEVYESVSFESFRYDLKERVEKEEKKLKELTNRLFVLHLDNAVTEDEYNTVMYSFNHFFSYANPSNIKNILLFKMDSNLDKDINKLLFNGAVSFSKNNDGKWLELEKLKGIARKYNLDNELNEWLNPKKRDWEFKAEKCKAEQETEKQKTIDINEKNLRDKTDMEIQSDFSILNWIAKQLYIKGNKRRYLTSQTFARLKRVLKNAIYSELISPEYLTIESLANNSPQIKRNIDTLYYVSCSLNDDVISSIEDAKFLKYLYINSLVHEFTGNIIHGNLVEQMRSDKFEYMMDISKEYIELLIKAYSSENKKIILKYINMEKNNKKLDNIIKIFLNKDDTIEYFLLKSFLENYGLQLSLDEINIFLELDVLTSNKDILTALKIFKEDKEEKFTEEMAVLLYRTLIDGREFLFSDLNIKFIYYLMNQFNTEESIKFHNGIQSYKNMCASFLRSTIFSSLDVELFYKLNSYHQGKDDVWNNRILNKINELEQIDLDNEFEQIDSDNAYTKYSIENIKEFIVSDTIVSLDDFYIDIKDKINRLKVEIEDNRNNEKQSFYRDSDNKKTEDECRDVLFLRLQDRYGDYFELIREKHEANNRVDINIKSKKKSNFEIQIECKRDDNQSIYTAIENQLIDKYFSTNLQYGIYLIFYFGEKKNKELFLQKVYDSIPLIYENSIEVICIDLRVK